MTTPAAPLTRMQRKTLEFIRSYILEHGVSPSYAEIAASLERSKGAVHKLVAGLVQRHAVTHTRCARSISIVGGNAITLTLPAELDHGARELAKQYGATVEATIIECVRHTLEATRRAPKVAA